MNTNDSEPLDDVDKLLDYLVYYSPLKSRMNPEAVKDNAKRTILTHYRSVRDIREAIGEDEKPSWTFEDRKCFQEANRAFVTGRNEVRASIRSSLNLDGGTKHE